MFLIIMLSFAIISKVSAAPSDDAEPCESGLNVAVKSVNSTETGMHGEGSFLASSVPVNHSGNNQTSLRNAAFAENENKNFYEQMLEKHNALDKINASIINQKQMSEFDYKKTVDCNRNAQCEKMENFLNSTQSLSKSAESVTPHKLDYVFTELIGMNNISVAFQSSRKDNFQFREFMEVLPQFMPTSDMIFLLCEYGSFEKQNSNSGQLNKDLPIEDNISLQNAKLLKSNGTIFSDDENYPIEITDIDDALNFLPNSNETQNLEHVKFPNTKTFSHNYSLIE